MKHLILIITAFIFTLSSCSEKEQDLQSDIAFLKKEKTSLKSDVNNLYFDKLSKTAEIDSLNEKLRILKIYESGREPKYVLKLQLKQSHISLSVSKHIKDAMNKVYFEIPVDKDFYNSVQVGTKLVDNFRTGSFIMSGSFGDWVLTVKGKEIR